MQTKHEKMMKYEHNFRRRDCVCIEDTVLLQIPFSAWWFVNRLLDKEKKHIAQALLNDVNNMCFEHEFHQQLGEHATSVSPASTSRSQRSGNTSSRSKNFKKLRKPALSPLDYIFILCHHYLLLKITDKHK